MSRADIGNVMIEDLDEREGFIAALESRFLFLAADARSTLRLVNHLASNRQRFAVLVLVALTWPISVPTSRPSSLSSSIPLLLLWISKKDNLNPISESTNANNVHSSKVNHHP